MGHPLTSLIQLIILLLFFSFSASYQPAVMSVEINFNSTSSACLSPKFQNIAINTKVPYLLEVSVDRAVSMSALPLKQKDFHVSGPKTARRPFPKISSALKQVS
eukprot:TRINITY_DN15438_c1_g3_i1.p1 TRINITY_DN15438_c1_g3~~TRINITY_DN15438_c1_g3_i1.p1  ORF type:complete len:120 (-),score=9.24 TRINITY_DN15438_c1_g3_i1:39-350(-)